MALLGAGIGAKHIDGYLALPDRFEVALVCDLDTARAEAEAERARAQATDSLDAAIAADVDVIDICLPPSMHVPVAVKALARGRHVVIEKPIAGSVAEADALVAAEAQSDARVFPVFQYRYGRAFDALAALTDAGMLGRPQVASLETHWNRGADYYAVRWRGTWARELGGAVLSHAIHAHDLLTRAFGPVADVSARLATRINPVETEDCAAIAFTMESGALATSSITLGAAEDTSRLKFIYENATIESQRLPYTPGEADWTVTARDPARQGEMEAIATAAVRRREGYAGLFEAIADALDGDGGREVTLAEGAASVELVSAIYQSDRTGARVALPLDRSLPICRSLRPAA